MKLEIWAGLDQIGVVLQNSRLASGSVYENICGGAQLSIDRAWEIARLAGFDADLEAMPMGMQTLVAEGVNTLPGGQRQRLLIARALAHRPRLLLMTRPPARSTTEPRLSSAIPYRGST